MVLDLGVNLRNYVIGDRQSLVNKQHILLGVLSGLSHLHSIDFIHCDIKPENIIVIDEGDGIVKSKLIDLADVKNSKPCVWTGTAEYAPPEILGIIGNEYGRGEKIEHAYSLDIWSVGLCMIFIYSDGDFLPEKISNTGTFIVLYRKWALINNIMIYIGSKINSHSGTLDNRWVHTSVIDRILENFEKNFEKNELDMFKIAAQCLTIDPLTRPSAIELAIKLRSNLVENAVESAVEVSAVELDYKIISPQNSKEITQINIDKLKDCMDHYRENSNTWPTSWGPSKRVDIKKPANINALIEVLQINKVINTLDTSDTSDTSMVKKFGRWLSIIEPAHDVLVKAWIQPETHTSGTSGSSENVLDGSVTKEEFNLRTAYADLSSLTEPI